ncbi:CHASE domain-containing protein [Ideonella sp.]|jgi:PAS domain S-box-containing protein|uniref:CHASE domain-containing protein n=1 Tax=Ideonella sp. TaxID=1929293 RepID=UPI0037C14DBD
MPSTTHRSSWLLPFVLTALVYGAAGKLALWLAVPPAFAAPLFPAAGVALAAILIYGWRMVPAVFVGSLVVNGPLGDLRMLNDAQALLTAAGIGVGAALQGALGAWWVRRHVKGELALDEPREALALGLLGGPLACLLNASFATLLLRTTGAVSEEAMYATWLTWWSGDTLGVLIATPVALTVIGTPRSLWASRRLTVGLPLIAVTTVLVIATLLMAKGEEQRRIDQFNRDASQLANAVESGLHEPLHALDALRGLFVVADKVSTAKMEASTRPWLAAHNGLQAMGFAQRVTRSQISAFEAEARADGLPDFKFFERPDGQALTRDEAEVLAIRHIQPMSTNAAALGVNSLSAPAARNAIFQSLATDAPAASAAFRLTQAKGDETGVVIYRLVTDNPSRGGQALASPEVRGVVFVTLQTDAAVTALMGIVPAYLNLCLVDVSPVIGRARLAGPLGCESAAPADHVLPRRIEFANRLWELRISASSQSLPGAQRWSLWFFSVVGLVAVAMLSALLLTITGRARRVEQAVAERTADLSREVEERQRTEAALRESEERIRNILDHVPLGIVYADVAGGIREANPQLRLQLGFEAIELHTRSLGALAHPSDRQALDALIRRIRRDPTGSVRQRLRLMRSDGQVVWMQMGLTALRNPQGEVWRLVGVFEDITEHLKLADAERAREHAETASRAKSDFLSRMSHELRTPLNAILGFTQLLALDKQPPLSPRQAERAAQVQHAGWHLLHMIDDMLDLTRIESGHMKLEPTAVPLADMLTECLSMVQPAAENQGIELLKEFPHGPLHVLGDRTRVKQILTNLCSNAVKYNRAQGLVRCEVRRGAPGQVEIRVHDSGLGLSPEQLAGLFQPFNRAGREHSSIEGTGLGLVISRRLAELMGGTLVASSQNQQGSIFTLTLPEARAPRGHIPSSRSGLSTQESYAAKRVVYVEDNETNAEVMKGVLSRRPQVTLSIAETGQMGLATILSELPDLVLLDMQLPDMDGLAILQALRANPSTRDIPVMMVSADATTVSIEQAFREGATDYVTKPLDIGTFLAQLDQLLEPSTRGLTSP